jgi:hypothetical protein
MANAMDGRAAWAVWKAASAVAEGSSDRSSSRQADIIGIKRVGIFTLLPTQIKPIKGSRHQRFRHYFLDLLSGSSLFT